MRYEVVQQQVNMGPVSKSYYATSEEAGAAFDQAVDGGAIFVELFDLDLDTQLQVQFPRPVWH